jgi:hypothetical protein
MTPARITRRIGGHRPDRVMTLTSRAPSIRNMTSAIDVSERPQSAAAPVPRDYEPGTNTLVTTWQVPTGWVVVHLALIEAAARIILAELLDEYTH